jgi:hypothetical protein
MRVVNMDGFGGGGKGMTLTSKTTIAVHDFAGTPRKHHEKANVEFYNSKHECRQMFMFKLNRN